MLKEAIHLEKLPVTNIGNNQFLVTESGINYVVSITSQKTDHGDTIITIHTLDTKGRSRSVGDIVHYDASKNLLKDPESGYEVFVNVQSEKEGGYPAPFQMSLEKEGMQIEVPVAMNLILESDSEDEEEEKKKRKNKKRVMNWKRFAKLGLVVSAMTALDSIFMFTPRFAPPVPAVLDMCPQLLCTGLLENPFLAPPVNANLPEFGLTINPPPTTTSNINPTKTSVQGTEPLPLPFAGQNKPIQPVKPMQLVPQVPVKEKQTFGPWGSPNPASVIPQGKKPAPLKLPFGPHEEPRPATIVPPTKETSMEDGTIDIEKYVAQSIVSIIKANPSSAVELEKSLKGFDKAIKFSGFRNTKPYKVVIKPYTSDDVTSEIIMKSLAEFNIDVVPPPKMNSKVESVKPLTMQLVSQIVTLSSSSSVRYSTIKQTIESLTQLYLLGVPEALEALPHAYAAMGSDKPSKHLFEISKLFRTPSVLKTIEERHQQPFMTLEMDTPTVSQVMTSVDNIKTKAKWVAGHAVHGLLVTLPNAYSYGYSQTFDDPYADYSLSATLETALTLAAQVKNLGVLVSSTISNIPLKSLTEKVFSKKEAVSSNTGSLSLDSYNNDLGVALEEMEKTKTLLKNSTNNINSTKESIVLQEKLVNTCKHSFNNINKILDHEYYDIAATKHICNAWVNMHPGYLSWIAFKADNMVCAANTILTQLPKKGKTKTGTSLNPVTQQSRVSLKQSHHLKQNPKKTEPSINVGTSSIPPLKSSNKFLYLQEVPYLRQNPNLTSQPNDSLYLPFMSEPTYNEELYPFLEVEHGFLIFPHDDDVHYQNDPNFYTGTYEQIKKIKWHSKQIENAVNLIINDNKLEKIHKNNIITRIVCTYYLGRRGIDTKLIENPEAEAIKDAGSLVNVFGRVLTSETLDKFKSISLDKNDVIISAKDMSIPNKYINNAILILTSFSLHFAGQVALNSVWKHSSSSLVHQPLDASHIMSGIQYNTPSTPQGNTMGLSSMLASISSFMAAKPSADPAVLVASYMKDASAHFVHEGIINDRIINGLHFVGQVALGTAQAAG